MFTKEFQNPVARCLSFKQCSVQVVQPQRLALEGSDYTKRLLLMRIARQSSCLCYLCYSCLLLAQRLVLARNGETRRWFLL